MRNERALICMVMACVAEVMMCLIFFLVVSMLGALLLGGLFFIFDWFLLAKMAMDEERECEERAREWERKNANEEKTE